MFIMFPDKYTYNSPVNNFYVHYYLLLTTVVTTLHTGSPELLFNWSSVSFVHVSSIFPAPTTSPNPW